MNQSRCIPLCRLGFVLFCILPTTGVAGWIVSRGGSSPAATKAEWERELSSRLGLSVEIAGLSYTAAGIAQLTNVSLLDPETGVLVAEATAIEVVKGADGWTVDAAGLALDVDGFAALSRSVHHGLLPNRNSLNIRWLPHDVILHRGSSGQTLKQLSATFGSDAAGSRVEIAFRLPGQVQGDEPVRLGGSRTHEQSANVTRWQLNTAGQSLPCWIGAALVPEVMGLGPDCAFRGKLFVTQAAGGSRSELAGTFAGVDLDALVTERFPHQLSGAATVTLERAVVEGGRLNEFRGRVNAQRGAISASLLAAAAEHLKLEPGPEVAKLMPAASVAFTQLAVDVTVSGAWISLVGTADSDHSGILLANRNGTLLTAPPDHAVTSAGLLRTLVPDSQHQVPATQQTAALVRLLPLPDVAPVSRAAAVHTPTRLAPAAAEAEATVRQPVLR